MTVGVIAERRGNYLGLSLVRGRRESRSASKQQSWERGRAPCHFLDEQLDVRAAGGASFITAAVYELPSWG